MAERRPARRAKSGRSVDVGSTHLLDHIRGHAFSTLAFTQRRTTNLYVDQRVYQSGELIGPRRQQITARRPSLLVFADDDPMANFSHPCRYLLYDAQTGELDRTVPAVFPPFVKAAPRTLQAFHQPVQFAAEAGVFRPAPFFPCIRRPIGGARYAILFSGMSNRRHLNDMEFLYRVLIDIYSFSAEDIYVLHYDGTLDTQDGTQTIWPGNNSAYRIQITGEGTRKDFEDAVDDLKKRIKREDLLLIHTNNHGDYDGVPGTANLCTYPSWDGYYAGDFADKIAGLPKYRKLIVMMEQCHAGGFNDPVLSKSTADATSVASAAIEPNSSYVTADGNWDPFARDWIAAQAGHDPFGVGLSFNPDTDHDGSIAASEAFHYADVIKDPRDTPNFSQSSSAGAAIALGQEYSNVPWWCRGLLEELWPWFHRIPPEEFYGRLRRIQPELVRIAQTLDARALAIEKEFGPKVKAIVRKEFGT